MKRCFERARRRHIEKVILEVREGNHAAIGLYAKLGFTTLATRPRYYDDTGEDALVMEKKLVA